MTASASSDVATGDQKPSVGAHTPTPWTACDRVVVVTAETHGYSTWIANSAVGGADGLEQAANAAFIVRACNAHDDMLAALKACVEYWGDPETPCEISLHDKVTSAIARAEGRT